MSIISVKESFEIQSCCTCGIRFGLPIAYVNNRRKDAKGFKCPNDHPLVFPKKTNASETKIKTLEIKVANLETEVKNLEAENARLEVEKTELAEALHLVKLQETCS